MKNYYMPYNYEGIYRPYVNDIRAGASAFRALNNVNTPLEAHNANKVRFQTEQYDLANEYDLNTSTFVPRENGVYTLTSSVKFKPFNSGPYNLDIVFLITNKGETEGRDNEAFAGKRSGIITTSETLWLNAGDQVVVGMRSSINGMIQGDGSTTFSAVKVFP